MSTTPTHHLLLLATAAAFLPSTARGAGAFNDTAQCAAFTDSPQCLFSIADATGESYDFDLRTLCSPVDGYNLTSLGSLNTFKLNICGFSPWRCTPTNEIRASRGTVIQWQGDDPAGCQLNCTDWDTLAPACCSAHCTVIGSSTFYTVANNASDVAGGGVTLVFAPRPSAPTDPFPCPLAAEPRTLEILRSVAINLQCDPASNDTSVVTFDPVVETSACVYAVTGYSAAACGRSSSIPSDSPSTSASSSASPSVTPSSSATGTPSRTDTPSSSRTGAPSITPSSSSSSSGSASSSTTPLVSPPPTTSPAAAYVYYSNLDRDMGIGVGGLFAGVLLSALVVMGSHRRVFPWQWEGGGGGGGGGGYSARMGRAYDGVDDAETTSPLGRAGAGGGALLAGSASSPTRGARVNVMAPRGYGSTSSSSSSQPFARGSSAGNLGGGGGAAAASTYGSSGGRGRVGGSPRQGVPGPISPSAAVYISGSGEGII